MILLFLLLCMAACWLSKKITVSSKINDTVHVALFMIVSRILLLAFAFIVLYFKYPGQDLIALLSQNGDVPHFLHLAEYGYSVGDEYENLMVFYPFFPLCIRIVNLLINNYYLSGLLISNISSIVAACVLYRLFSLEVQSSTAKRAVLFLFAYPFAFFTLFAYTEGLFLMLCALCAFYARQQQWIRSGLCGMLCALTRNQGVIMFGFAVYEYFLTVKETIRTGKSFKQAQQPRAAALFLIPLGLFFYLLLNRIYFGSWFQFLEFQAAEPWYNGADLFVKNLAQHVDMAQQYYPQLAFIIYIPQLILFFTSFALILYGCRKGIRTSYLLHAAAYTLISYTSSWLISGPRYMLGCIFMFLPLAILAENKTIRYILYVLTFSFFFVFFILYLHGYAIM